MSYPEAAIRALTNSFENDDDAYNWLIRHNFRELAAFRDVIHYDNKQALQWLSLNKKIVILLFIDALNGEPDAIKELLAKKETALAAAAAAINKDEDAYRWLARNGFRHFMPLVNVLMPETGDRYVNRNNFNIDIPDNFHGPDSDNTFGFGGGDFGGAGTDGKW